MTDYRLISIIAAVSFALFSTPAHAQNMNDVRCLLASNLYSKTAKDPNAKRMADAALHFYLGRIDGRFNRDQLRAAFVAQERTITAANSGSVMRACFQRMQRSAKVIESVGQQIAQQKH